MSNLSDDYEMGKRTRLIYTVGNTILSKFRNCDESSKILLFKTQWYNVYSSALWSTFRVGSFAKLKVAHNDIFRNLFNVKRCESASNLFAEKRTNNLDAICRNSMNSLMNRILDSPNSIIQVLCNSEVRVHSRIWKHWAINLGVMWDQIMLT